MRDMYLTDYCAGLTPGAQSAAMPVFIKIATDARGGGPGISERHLVETPHLDPKIANATTGRMGGCA